MRKLKAMSNLWLCVSSLILTLNYLSQVCCVDSEMLQYDNGKSRPISESLIQETFNIRPKTQKAVSFEINWIRKIYWYAIHRIPDIMMVQNKIIQTKIHYQFVLEPELMTES